MNLLLAACVVNALIAWPYLLMAVTLGPMRPATIRHSNGSSSRY